MAEITEQKDSEAQKKEEKSGVDITAVREKILSKYAQAGLNDKDAAEKADTFLRQHAFRPHAAEIDPQLAGLMERAAEAARQQAAERELAEEKTEAAAPVSKVEEKNAAPEVKTPAGNAKNGSEKTQDEEKDAPVFTFGTEQTADKENQKAAGQEAADMDELYDQLMRTAWKNKFMQFEDEEENKEKGLKHRCPFSQIQSMIVQKEGEKLSYVAMKLNSGALIENKPNSVNMNYTREVPSFEDCMTMVRVGMEKGWKSAKLNGPEEYKAQMYLAMRAMGIKAIGYAPTEALEKKGDELAAQYKKDREHAESMDRRYPALEEARGDLNIEEVDAERYKVIRAKAEASREKTAENVKSAEPAAKTATTEKTAEADRSKTDSLKPNALNDKLPEEKKAELSGKFDKMVATLREQHPNVAKPADFKGKSPADLLKAYGNALTVVKKAEVKGSAKATSNALNVMRNHSGEGR